CPSPPFLPSLATSQIYTLSLHDALPIFSGNVHPGERDQEFHGVPGCGTGSASRTRNHQKRRVENQFIYPELTANHMKFSIKYTAFVLLFTAAAFAQKKDGDIGTEVVNVVKPYTPTISDAFKVKETPTIEDEDNSKKADIQYNIFSFPVASTFTPSKGRAASVDKTPQERIFKNFASLALGNYATVNAELFITENIGDNSYVGGMFRHLSSGGGI